MIETVRPHQVFGLVERSRRAASTVLPAPTSVSFTLLEKAVLAALVLDQQPTRIFEFGTYEGDATVLLASNASDARVYTLDLDERAVGRVSLDPGTPIRPDRTGLDYQERLLFRQIGGHLDEQIVELRGDSLTFDYKAYAREMDLVLVDANHQKPYVESDTRNALQMLAPGGTIIWDDYSDDYPDVGDVLCSPEFDELELFHIEGTKLVVYGSSRGFSGRIRGVRWAQ